VAPVEYNYRDLDELGPDWHGWTGEMHGISAWACTYNCQAGTFLAYPGHLPRDVALSVPVMGPAQIRSRRYRMAAQLG